METDWLIEGDEMGDDLEDGAPDTDWWGCW